MTPCYRFSIVVCTYRRPGPLSRLLEAVARLDYPLEQVEVVVVDDSGEGSLAPVIAPFRDKLAIRLLATPHVGPGPARRAGIDAALGYYLAFTDDDCIPERDWLRGLEEGLLAAPGAGVGGRTVNGCDGNRCSEATQFMIDLLMEDCNRDQVTYITTANAAFPAEAFRKANILERSWHNWGGEDREMCRRWRNAGWSLHYNTAIVVKHYHPVTLRQFFDQHFRYGMGSGQFHENAGYQSAGFYWRLFSDAPRKRGAIGGLPISGLIAWSQIATLAGHLRMVFSRRRFGPFTVQPSSAGERQAAPPPSAI